MDMALIMDMLCRTSETRETCYNNRCSVLSQLNIISIMDNIYTILYTTEFCLESKGYSLFLFQGLIGY